MIVFLLMFIRELVQGDSQTKRFLFMYYGNKLDVKYFIGKFGVYSAEGTTDDRGCHFIFLRTGTRIRTSQLSAAIDEYNLSVPSSRAMRLQGEPYQPAIVTMSSKKMEGSIYSKIMEDKQKSCKGCKSNFWSWEQASSYDELQDDTAQLDASSSSKSTTKLRRLLGTDMVHSSYNPTCPKKQRAVCKKNPSTVQLDGGMISFSYGLTSS
jgi:hypothetical protein